MKCKYTVVVNFRQPHKDCDGETLRYKNDKWKIPENGTFDWEYFKRKQYFSKGKKNRNAR